MCVCLQALCELLIPLIAGWRPAGEPPRTEIKSTLLRYKLQCFTNSTPTREPRRGENEEEREREGEEEWTVEEGVKGDLRCTNNKNVQTKTDDYKRRCLHYICGTLTELRIQDPT